MEIKKRKIDIIKNIDKKKNIIAKNTKLIDNLFINKLYRNYLLSQRKKRNFHIFDLISKKPGNNKLVEKMIIDNVMKNIPQNLRQYFSDFEFKKFAHHLILSNSKKNNKINKSVTSVSKNKIKIKSRNKSSTNRLNKYNLKSENNTFNDNNKIDLLLKKDKDNNLSEDKTINKKKKFIIAYSRKNSSNILRYNNTTLNDNQTIKEIYENKYNKLYNTMSSKNNTNINSIFNSNNSINNLTEEESSKEPISSLNLSKAILTEVKNSNNIYNYNFLKKENKKIFLNLKKNDEQREKKYASKLLLDNNPNFNKRNLLNVPKKKFNTELILNSLSPKEIFIVENASNISNNLHEIKNELKSERKETPKNLKHMILKIKKEKNKDITFLRKEVNRNKYYEFFMRNKNQMERKKNIFKLLRNSFNSERKRRKANENSFIKILNNICDEEKRFDSVVKQVYKQNYWLRLNNNKKSAIDIKNRIAKINEKGIILNTLLNKINKLNNND